MGFNCCGTSGLWKLYEGFDQYIWVTDDLCRLWTAVGLFSEVMGAWWSISHLCLISDPMYSIRVFSPSHISTSLFLGKGGGSNIWARTHTKNELCCRVLDERDMWADSYYTAERVDKWFWAPLAKHHAPMAEFSALKPALSIDRRMPVMNYWTWNTSCASECSVQATEL